MKKNPWTNNNIKSDNSDSNVDNVEKTNPVGDIETQMDKLSLTAKESSTGNVAENEKATEEMATEEQLNSKENPEEKSRQPISLDEITGIRFGKCKWFNVAKGWGFITPEDGGQEVFVHQSVIQMPGFRSLGEREEVEFECKVSARGLEATRVTGKQGVDCYGSSFRPKTNKFNRRIRCYNCGEFANHVAKKCHLGPQPKCCHFCKKADHLYAQCPVRKNNNNNMKNNNNYKQKKFRKYADYN